MAPVVDSDSVSVSKEESLQERWRKLDKMLKDYEMLEAELKNFIQKGLLVPEPEVVNGKKKRGAKPK